MSEQRLLHIGWFARAADPAPAFDPGLDVPCPVCGVVLQAEPRTTVSLMPMSGPRSLFFRAHLRCWRDADERTRAGIESQVVDVEVGGIQ